MTTETKPTNPLAEFEAAIKELGGVDEAMRQLNELTRKFREMTPEEKQDIRQIKAPVIGEPLPPEKVLELLASSPEKGLFELERLHAVPEMTGHIGRIVTDAIRDKRLAPETRARLLWRYNHLDEYRDAAFAGARGVIPFGLLDTEAGRQQYCKMERTDFETVRCSNPDAETAWGVSWRQMKRAKAVEERGISLYVNGKPVVDDRGRRVRPPQPEGDEHHFRIVLDGPGLAMEWAFPKRLYHEASHAYVRTGAKDNKDRETVLTFSHEKEGWHHVADIHFRRGPDRLFHFAEVKRYCRKAYV